MAKKLILILGVMLIWSTGWSQDQVPSANLPVVVSLDKTPIREEIQRHRERIRFCYQRVLQRMPDVRGRLVVRFTIKEGDGAGRVTQAEVKESTLRHPQLERCVLDIFREMVFPMPAGGGVVIVTYPLVFKQPTQDPTELEKPEEPEQPESRPAEIQGEGENPDPPPVKLNRPLIRASRIRVLGAMSRDVVSRVVLNRRERLGNCYRWVTAARQPLGGQAKIRFVISTEGTVTDVKVLPSELGSPELETCLVEEIHRLVFPTASDYGWIS